MRNDPTESGELPGRDGPVQCLECGGDIPEGARLCAHCGSHQNRWRNEVLFASTLIGIASVTVTALAFLLSIWPEVRAVVAWRDEVEVVEFDGLGAIVLANRGDGPVYVSDLRAETGPFSFVRRINEVIEPGRLGIFQADSLWAAAAERYRTPRRSTTRIPPRDSASSYSGEGCHTILVMTESSPLFRLWTAGMGEDFAVFDEPAEVVVRYHGIDSGTAYEDTVQVAAVAGLALECIENGGAGP